MISSINYIPNYNQSFNKTQKKQSMQEVQPISEPQCDTVCFKGVGKLKQISLIAKVTKILFTGGGLLALAKFMESLSKDEAEFVDNYLSSQFESEDDVEEEIPTIEQGRTDFKEMNARNWVQKYKGNPELFEQLLLEEDAVEGETAKRLFFVQSLDTIRAFYKDTNALNRIYTRDNILELERRSDAWNSPIKDLQIDCKDFIEQKMFETDEEGRILLHNFAQEYKSSDKFASPFLHVNQAYEKQPEKLLKMYLTKDSHDKYPLDYLKDKHLDEQESALKIVKQTFQYKPELYKQILATYDADSLAKEKELQEKVNQIMENGWEFVDEEGNKVIAYINDRAVAERLVNGEIAKPYNCNNYKKYSDNGNVIEDSSGDNFYTSRTKYFYDDNNVCVKKVHSVSSKYNSSTETLTLVNGEWKSDKEGGWKDW